MNRTEELFQSPLANAMYDFVAFKRMQGYDYSGRVRILSLFDRFLQDQDCSDGLLRPQHFDAWLEAGADCSASYRGSLVSTVRQFSLYLHAHCPESAVVPKGILPKCPRRIRFRRIEPKDVLELMRAASGLEMSHPIAPLAIRFLIGLLYCTGLRIREALNLNLGDIDADRGAVFVRQGKFRKDRLVALRKSTLHALERWLTQRSRYCGTEQSAPVLIGGVNKRLTYWQASGSFKKLCRQCGLIDAPAPRLHDLRHNFACRCITQWRETGKDVQAFLPILANAMGHVDIFATQIYIHVDAAALGAASDRFHEHTVRQRRDLP